LRILAIASRFAAHFTQGEQAALAVVAREFQARQVCVLPIDAVAALAGACRSTVKNALREARKLGLIEVRERRIPGRKSLTNVVRVIDARWLGWLRLRGGELVAHGNSKLEFCSNFPNVFNVGWQNARGSVGGMPGSAQRRMTAASLRHANSTLRVASLGIRARFVV
jgi:hypothetical protein